MTTAGTLHARTKRFFVEWQSISTLVLFPLNLQTPIVNPQLYSLQLPIEGGLAFMKQKTEESQTSISNKNLSLKESKQD